MALSPRVGKSWDPTSLNQSTFSINRSHSSYEYGTRWAIGGVFKDHPNSHELYHMIKVPVPGFKDGDRFDQAVFRRIIEEALRDLHTDCIDVVQQMENRGQGFFCIRPRMAGLLTDRRHNRADLPEGDRFLDAEWDDRYRRL